MRDKKVRILEDGHLRQIRASAALQQGSQLLIPKTAVAQWQEPRPHRIKGDSPHYHAPPAITLHWCKGQDMTFVSKVGELLVKHAI